MILCNAEESDEMETFPGYACQGFVHICLYIEVHC